MANISARGDTAAIKLRKPDGGLVVVTRHGRLLAQQTKGAGYVLVDSHWVARDSAITHRRDVMQYLIDNRYPGSVEA